MSFAFNRFIVLGGVVVLMMGCGGSGGGGTTGGGGGAGAAPTIVTFTFTGAAPTTVATQIGAGAFKAATASSGTVTLSIPEGTT